MDEQQEARVSGAGNDAGGAYEKLLRAVHAFRECLDDGQRAALEHPYTFANASRWHTYPQWYLGARGRLGVDLPTLTDQQWQALDALLATALGARRNSG